MNNLSKYFLVCMNQVILEMDDDMSYDFGDEDAIECSSVNDEDESEYESNEDEDELDEDEDEDELDESEEDENEDDGELDEDESEDELDELYDDEDENESEEDEFVSDESNEDEFVSDEDESDEDESDEDESDEDDIDDVEDDIYAHSSIDNPEIISMILSNDLFAYSTANNKYIASKSTDWATIAKMTNIGMDRIFLLGKEVFVSGFNKISLKTSKNITKVSTELKNRGLNEYASRIDSLL